MPPLLGLIFQLKGTPLPPPRNIEIRKKEGCPLPPTSGCWAGLKLVIYQTKRAQNMLRELLGNSVNDNCQKLCFWGDLSPLPVGTRSAAGTGAVALRALTPSLRPLTLELQERPSPIELRSNARSKATVQTTASSRLSKPSQLSKTHISTDWSSTLLYPVPGLLSISPPVFLQVQPFPSTHIHVEEHALSCAKPSVIMPDSTTNPNGHHRSRARLCRQGMPHQARRCPHCSPSTAHSPSLCRLNPLDHLAALLDQPLHLWVEAPLSEWVPRHPQRSQTVFKGSEFPEPLPCAVPELVPDPVPPVVPGW